MGEEKGEVAFATHDSYGENGFLVMATNLHMEGHAPPISHDKECLW